MSKKPEYGVNAKVKSMLMSIVLLVSVMHTSTFARSHPFVFFTSADIPALQAKVSQSGSRSRKAYDLFFTGTPTLDLQNMGGLKHEVFYQKQLLQVALKYTITGDTKYADRAISGIDRAMEMYNPDTFNWEDTGWAKGISDAQKKMVGSWLWGWGFGEVARAVAVTYDIVYDQMTAAKRAQVLDWLERVCHHFKNNVNDGGRHDTLHNHTIPPYAALAFTCWIIRDDTTDDVIKNQYPSYANDFVRRWYDEMYFQPNGNFTESALYTYFGADTCFSYSAALHINNEPDILSGTSAYNVLKFIGHGTMAYQEEDGFPILPGFGDNHERYSITRYSCALVPILISQDPVQLFYYKHSIDDLNNMQSIANLTENNSIVNNNSLVNTVLFYPESLSERHPHDAGVSDGQLFLDRSGIGGSAALRSGWDLAGTGKDTVTAWFVNRYNRVNHNHHDMHAVELAAYGEYFLIDPMHELYGSPRHGTSLGHNHIIIDDIGLPSSAALTGGCHADCSTLGEIHGFTSGDGGTVLRGDARYSYIDRLPIAEALDRSNIGQVTREDIDNHGGPLDKAERVFGLINGGNNPPYAIIIDEIKQDNATHKYDFRLHTYKSLSGLGTPVNPFIADGTDADLYVTLVQPEAFTGSTGEYGERPSSARIENNNMIDAVQHEITGHFFAILYPRKNGMPNAAISSSAVENGVGAVVSWGSSGNDILLEKRGGSLVSYSNAVSGGRFASVRVQSGSVASYLLLEGKILSYNGTTLVSISGGGSASASANGTIASVDSPGTSGFSIYAPAATTMLLNGSKISITHNGDYIVFGDGGPNPPAPPRPPYPPSSVIKSITPHPPAEGTALPYGKRNGAMRVVYDNDQTRDVYTDEIMMAMASAGRIHLVGMITTRTVNGIGYDKYDELVTERRQMVNMARKSGMRHLPDPVKGPRVSLQPPTSEKIEDTETIGSDGSWLIVREARKASSKNPLIVICGGQLTAVADAYLLDPSIEDKVVVAALLGSDKDMRGFNGKQDPWASYIVLKRLTYMQFPQSWAIPKVPKDWLRKTLPDTPLKQWMLAKTHPLFPDRLPGDEDNDGQPVLPLLTTDYVVEVKRVAFGGWKTERFGEGSVRVSTFVSVPPNGESRAWVVVRANRDAGTQAWQTAMANPAAWKGIKGKASK